MKSIHVLLIEDNEGDIVLTKEAFEESDFLYQIDVETDGEGAINYLEKIEKQEDYPDIVLLDINLPKKNGHEVLQHIKSSEKLRKIPVIILTTSSSERDIAEAYSHCANSYITKPLNITDFMATINKVEDFWFNTVQLPKK